MPKYRVSYRANLRCSVVLEAESEDDAEALWEQANFNGLLDELADVEDGTNEFGFASEEED